MAIRGKRNTGDLVVATSVWGSHSADKERAGAQHGANARAESKSDAAKPAPPLVGISIHTLGGFSVTRHYASGEIFDVPATAWRHGRTLALAHYLTTRPGFEGSREAIRNALWPQVEPRAASAYLSNTIWNLRKALDASRDDMSILHVTETVVRLNAPRGVGPAVVRTPGVGVWIDTLALEAEMKQLKSVQEPEDQLLAAQRALSLYQGDFLPECSELRWTFSVRERYRALWASALVISARAYIGLQSSDEALGSLDRLLATMPDHEEGALLALQLLMKQNRQREARMLYEHIRAFYRSAYHLDPPHSLLQVVGLALASKRMTIPLPHRT